MISFNNCKKLQELVTFFKFLISQVIYRFFRLFPLNKKQIIFWCNAGLSYSCNPKYIIEYLRKNYNTNNLTLILACNDKETAIHNGFDFVKYGSAMFLYKVATSAVIIENSGGGSFFSARLGQTIIHTWHGGGAYKKVGEEIVKNTIQNKILRYASKQKKAVYLSSSKIFTDIHIKKANHFQNGIILNSGMPRNDLFFKENTKLVKKIKENLDLTNYKLVLYAPTWRNKGEDLNTALNPLILVKALESRFGGQWKLLIRAHFVSNNLQVYSNSSFIFDVSDYPDMQELLLISDVLITDYSSSIWDFAITKKPCFLFTPDLNSYKLNRDFFMPIETWGPSFSLTNEQLAQSIFNYDDKNFREVMSKHHIRFGSFERGNASDTVCKYLVSYLDIGN